MITTILKICILTKNLLQISLFSAVLNKHIVTVCLFVPSLSYSPPVMRKQRWRYILDESASA